MSQVRVRDIEQAIDQRFPTQRAEEWDRVGLLAGDPDAFVTGVSLALDPTVGSVNRAVESGANVLVTHHPAFLTPPQRLAPGRGPAGVLFSAVSQGVALINAHTNLDRDEEAQRLLPEMLGFASVKPLERSLQPMMLVTAFVPEKALERVTDAMSGAGAGRIGEYERCSFSVPGTGGFAASPVADPTVGRAGQRTQADEIRLEMVCPPSRARGVVSAATSAHPYEEPLITATDVMIARNSARLGMVSTPPEEVRLAELAKDAAARYGVIPTVWGPPEAKISRIATGTGSSTSLIGDALSSGCHVLVAGEVRYHDALDAVEAGLSIVELGHDVTEWPLVRLLESVVRSVEGLDAEAVTMQPSTPGWWTP